jgi:nitroreductase / dihydropteridine reductase
MEKTFLANLEWRFATKKFDPAKKVSEADLKKILRAVRFAPSSMGLQPFRVLVVRDTELRKELRTVSNNQPQVADCSVLLVFCTDTDIKKRVNDYVDFLAKAETGLDVGAMRTRLNGFAGRLETKNAETWAARQAYIAIGFAMAACAELGIDSCPMEGFDAVGVDGKLKLSPNLKPAVFLAVGYREAGPAWPKFRFPDADIFSER